MENKEINSIFIRKGIKEDCAIIITLIKELAVYEKSLTEVSIELETFVTDGFSDKPHYHFLVAEKITHDNKKEIIGMVLYYFGYSSWKGKILYLDDLIVREPYRNSKIGGLLFEALMEIAVISDIKQIRWHVLDWNAPAISFYKKYHADLSSEWVTGKLNIKQITEYLDNKHNQLGLL